MLVVAGAKKVHVLAYVPFAAPPIARHHGADRGATALAGLMSANGAKPPAPAAPELMLLVLSAGMPGEALAVALDGLKTSSKAIGSHKRRSFAKP